MPKIKQIRQKISGTIFGEPIDLGVDAENVDVTIVVNGKSVMRPLSEILDDISAQLSNVSSLQWDDLPDKVGSEEVV